MTTFVTVDRRIGVVVDADARRQLVEHCTRAGRKETGGILIGRYSDSRDQAVITGVTGPPRDSIRRRFSFVRGLVGVQRKLNRAWRSHDYYLGEWHFHPFAAANLSPRDRTQILDFSKDPAYACPEAILIVVGGNPADSPEFQVAVVLDGDLVSLLPSNEVDTLAEFGPNPGARLSASADGPADGSDGTLVERSDSTP